MNEIWKPRLYNFKEKTHQYSFTVKYIKGIYNYANTLSWYPVSKPDFSYTLLSNELEPSVVDLTSKLASEKLLTQWKISKFMQIVTGNIFQK